ncbi:MAG: hypothetical protein RHS_2268 [Robinsoniella sp. RHS]|nr:MAG: hypothetical protein RHS_2268 [Robinsoniella sp. RHS]
MKVSVEDHFLTERGSRRLEASLSSDDKFEFPTGAAFLKSQ